MTVKSLCRVPAVWCDRRWWHDSKGIPEPEENSEDKKEDASKEVKVSETSETTEEIIEEVKNDETIVEEE